MGGVRTLVFPHHENEIAQSAYARDGSPPARFWLHNGHVTVSGEKMSKSLGNVLTVRDLLTQFSGEAIRYFLLSAHYRAPINVTYERLLDASRALDRIYVSLRTCEHLKSSPSSDAECDPHLLAALNDDLNTPRALASLHKSIKNLNCASDNVTQQRLKNQILSSGSLLGFDFQHAMTNHQVVSCHQEDDQWIEERIAERAAARRCRDFDRADAIRKALIAAGVTIEDGPNRTGWYRRSAITRQGGRSKNLDYCDFSQDYILNLRRKGSPSRPL